MERCGYHPNTPRILSKAFVWFTSWFHRRSQLLALAEFLYSRPRRRKGVRQIPKRFGAGVRNLNSLLENILCPTATPLRHFFHRG